MFPQAIFPGAIFPGAIFPPGGVTVPVVTPPAEGTPTPSVRGLDSGDGWTPSRYWQSKHKQQQLVGDVAVSVAGPAIHATGSVQYQHVGAASVSVAGPAIHAAGMISLPVAGVVQFVGPAARVQAIGRVEVFVDPEDEVALVEFLRGW